MQADGPEATAQERKRWPGSARAGRGGLPVRGCCAAASQTLAAVPAALTRTPSAVGWNWRASTGCSSGPSTTPGPEGRAWPGRGRRQSFTWGRQAVSAGLPHEAGRERTPPTLAARVKSEREGQLRGLTVWSEAGGGAGHSPAPRASYPTSPCFPRADHSHSPKQALGSQGGSRIEKVRAGPAL